MEQLNEDILQALTYSELRKVAKEKGINKRMKTNDFIKAILTGQKSADDDSFTANEQEVVNSCKKNKEEHFDKSKDTPSDTPRRDTYTLSRPSDIVAVTSQAMTESASPMLKASSKKKHKVSFVTPVRKSLRLQNSAIKSRPKTPLDPSRQRSESISKSINEVDENVMKSPIVSNTEAVADNLLEKAVEEKLTVDMLSPKAKDLLSLEEKTDNPKSAGKSKRVSLVSKHSNTPGVLASKSTEKRKGTPRLQLANKITKSTGKKVSPRSAAKNKQISSVSKVKKTPKFDQIHKKAFEKMESIDDYQKRKAVNSAKKLNEQKGLRYALNSNTSKVNTKIPKKFGGIPFIPSVTRIQDIKTNFADLAKKEIKKTPGSNKKAAMSTVNKAKTPSKGGNGKSPATKKPTPFDLKASLTRKLRYKPHTGPLKPLNHPDVKASCLSHTFVEKPAKAKKQVVVKEKQNENVVVKAKRTEARTFLRGVRTNKRFELQMQKRKL